MWKKQRQSIFLCKDYFFILKLNFSMKQFVLIILLILAVFRTIAAQNVIKGQVLDFDIKEPIVGASVFAEETKMYATTDENGKFEINASPTAILQISYVGYSVEKIKNFGVKPLIIELKGMIFNVNGFSTLLPGDEKYLYIKPIPLIFQQPNISVKNIENQSLIKLKYGFSQFSQDAFSDSSQLHYAEQLIHYEVYKSSNLYDFKLIGETLSDGRIETKTQNRDVPSEFTDSWSFPTQHILNWGFSEFSDDDLSNNLDTTFYKILGYILRDKDLPYPLKLKYPKRQYVLGQITKIVKIKSNKLTINNLYISPNSSIVNLFITSPNEGTSDIALINMTGQVVMRYKQPISKGINSLNLTMIDMLSGAYILQVTQGNLVDKWKFMIVK